MAQHTMAVLTRVLVGLQVQGPYCSISAFDRGDDYDEYAAYPPFPPLRRGLLPTMYLLLTNLLWKVRRAVWPTSTYPLLLTTYYRYAVCVAYIYLQLTYPPLLTYLLTTGTPSAWPTSLCTRAARR